MTISAKHDFLKAQLFQMTVAATMQRNRVYAGTATEVDRADFRVSLRKQLDLVTPSYDTSVDHTKHEENISLMADALSRSHAGILADGRFRIGTSQKALNLWLKYLWCSNFLLLEPPHCPFDRIIIQSHLPEKVRHINWTTLDNMPDYGLLWQAAREAAEAKSISIAQWELNAYGSGPKSKPTGDGK
jgi:hypothetical protein